jgi:hypothetical protein
MEIDQDPIPQVKMPMSLLFAEPGMNIIKGMQLDHLEHQNQ